MTQRRLNARHIEPNRYLGAERNPDDLVWRPRLGPSVARGEEEPRDERFVQSERRLAPVPRGMRRNDAQSLHGAVKGFERFHSRKVGQGVYPFHESEEAIFDLPPSVVWPDGVRCLGLAERTMYESDKWSKRGKTTQYYHDHDHGKVMFCVPECDGDGLRPMDLPFGWPDEVMLIGECIGFAVTPFETGQVTDGIMKGSNVLVASPDGWVNPRKPNRVFLAIINLDGGGVESIICGGDLRITAHGIEG